MNEAIKLKKERILHDLIKLAEINNYEIEEKTECEIIEYALTRILHYGTCNDVAKSIIMTIKYIHPVDESISE